VLGLIKAAAKAQLQLARHDPETLMPILTSPLVAIVSTAILVYSGRSDLAGWALVAALLMTLGQMGILVAGEIIANERGDQILEIAVASPAPYSVLLLTRIVMLTSLGVVGFIEGWLIVRLLFGISVPIFHPLVFAATVFLTIFAASGTMLIAASIFCFARTTRTYQNAISGPLYLIGGVLVPVTYLPDWIQPASKAVFLYWSADLLRDSLQPGHLQQLPLRLAAICGLGIAATALGANLLHRMLNHLRREGRLGLT
jgi:ABC-2 type transport system permease protein